MINAVSKAVLKESAEASQAQPKSKQLKIGELAALANVAVATIRYYETLGLLDPTSRGDSGYRYYDDEAVRQLQFIKKAQALQFSLSEIRQILGVRRQGSPACGLVRGLLDRKITHLDEQIRLMQSLKVELEDYRDRWIDRPLDNPDSEELCSLIEEVSSRHTPNSTL
jgi:DNA-binding transcriptional MerR regulator